MPAEPLSAKLILDHLYDSEGTRLDFKRDQYRFVGASDAEKAELLKDVIAFANAFRREEALILIGVDEMKGTRARLVGITDHLDDASLQQFVNSKTNRKITFSYHEVEVEGKTVGVIRIPVQQRPIFLKNNFATDPKSGKSKLLANAAYMRVGSTTEIANPDELYLMGQSDAKAAMPSAIIDLQFADKRKGIPLGSEVSTSHLLFEYDSRALPDHGVSAGFFAASMIQPNRDFWREAANHVAHLQAFWPLGFFVKNLGEATATDVNVEFAISRTSNVTLLLEEDFPGFPAKDQFDNISRSIRPRRGKPQTTLETRGDHQVVRLNFGKLQPHQSELLSEPVYLRSTDPTRRIEIDATIRADEFGTPLRKSLSVTATCERRELDWDLLTRIVEDHLAEEEKDR